MSPKYELFLSIVLGALMSFAALSTDLYLPAMPEMSADLRGSAELTISGFLAGFSLGQLFWGALSDKIGRKKPLLFGLIVFIIGSILCALSQNIIQIVAARIIQALGACVAPVVARAIIRDLYDSVKGAQKLSLLTACMAIVPTICPFIGAQILKISSWHLIFWLMAIIATVVFFCCYGIKESLPEGKRIHTTLQKTIKNYRILLFNFSFMHYVLALSFFYMALFAFVAGSPGVYIEHFGVAKENYGFLTAINIIGIMTLSFLNRFLVRKFSLNTLLKASAMVMIIASSFTFLFSLFNIGGLTLFVISIFFIYSTNGIIATCCIISALSKTKHLTGSAAAIIGWWQYGGGILSSMLLAIIGSKTPLTLASIIFIFSLCSASFILIGKKQ